MGEEEGHIQGQDLDQDHETGTGGAGDQGQDPEAGSHETGHTANLVAEVHQEVDHHRAGQGHAQGQGHQNRMKLEKTDNTYVVQTRAIVSSVAVNRLDCQKDEKEE